MVMRGLIVVAMFVASLASAEFGGYTEARNLQLPADGIAVLELDTGAGSLTITGVADAEDIRVNAQIRIIEDDEQTIRKVIESDMNLALERNSDRARLTATFDDKFWGGSDEHSIDLEVRMPASMKLKVDDGAGPIDIREVSADIRIDDGSGPILIRNIGNLRIDDGSGSINVHAAAGDVTIDDGSGLISVEQVGGSVIIDDGSGAIDIRDVEYDLIIVDEGSGSLAVSDIRGTVKTDES
jgi:DUF4097 and DUF4098 domain-containing protein YvlB